MTSRASLLCCLVLGGLLCGAGLAAGPDEPVHLRVPTKGSCVLQGYLSLGSMSPFSTIRYMQAGKDGRPDYSLAVFPGDLVYVVVPDEPGELRTDLFFPMVFDGQLDPKQLRAEGGRVTLNGRRIFLDLMTPEDIAATMKLPESELADLRAVRINADEPGLVGALQRLAGAGVVVSGGGVLKDKPQLLDALVAIRPVGLIAQGLPGWEKLVARLPKLRYLAVPAASLQPIVGLAELRQLDVIFQEPTDETLELLKGSTKLRSLTLMNVSPANLKGIERFGGLRRFALSNAPELADVSFLRQLPQLRTLVLGNCEKLTDIGPVGTCGELRQLAVLSNKLDQIESYQPIAKCQQLELLLLNQNVIKDRSAEVEQLRMDLPETQITGFCLGSAWMLLVLPLAMVGLLLGRRRVRRAA